jgi:hypothetical protein
MPGCVCAARAVSVPRSDAAPSWVMRTATTRGPVDVTMLGLSGPMLRERQRFDLDAR